MGTKANNLDAVGTINPTHIIILSDPATGKLWKTTVGDLLALVVTIIGGGGTGGSDPNKADLISGEVPLAQLPTILNDVIEIHDPSLLPAVGQAGTIYMLVDDNTGESTFIRWDGTTWTQAGNINSAIQWFQQGSRFSQAPETQTSYTLI